MNERTNRVTCRDDVAARSTQEIGRDAVALARRFHELYEELAPTAGYETRPETRVPWAALPRENRFLMIAVCTVILKEMADE